MSNYIKHLQAISNPKTFQRKVDYFKYNYSKYLPAQPEDKRFLEIGPGLGECLSFLNSQGIANIDIMDNDDSVMAYVKEHFKVQQSFLSDDLQSIDGALNMYDGIFLTQIFEHVPPAQYKGFITTLTKHLNPGGFIVITVPNMGNPLTICERYADITHYNGFTDVSLKDLVVTYCANEQLTATVYRFMIPPYSVVNVVRIAVQKLLHGCMLLINIANGGTYSRILTPNITLLIKK